MSDSFGNYIRSLRGSESRRAVAKRAGFTAEYLRKIENAGQVPQKDKQLALARALGVEAKDLLVRALRVENRTAYRILTAVKARYPNLRKLLLSHLEGPGASIILADMVAQPVSPHERLALALWSTVREMDQAGLAGQGALSRARKKCSRPDYIESQICDFMSNNLISWRADPETGRQCHLADKESVKEMLNRAGRVLGLNPMG